MSADLAVVIVIAMVFVYELVSKMIKSYTITHTSPEVAEVIKNED